MNNGNRDETLQPLVEQLFEVKEAFYLRRATTFEQDAEARR
jgi:hypothetical protein